MVVPSPGSPATVGMDYNSSCQRHSVRWKYSRQGSDVDDTRGKRSQFLFTNYRFGGQCNSHTLHSSIRSYIFPYSLTRKGIPPLHTRIPPTTRVLLSVCCIPLPYSPSAITVVTTTYSPFHPNLQGYNSLGPGAPALSTFISAPLFSNPSERDERIAKGWP